MDCRAGPGRRERRMISATVTLTQPQSAHRQFVATSGTGHHLLLDDAAGNSGAKPIELVAIALAGCTAFDVINILRKKRQQVTAYEVKVEADQASNPPQVFTEVRIHHVLTGNDISPQAVEDAIRLSEEKYCSVGAMVQQSAELHTTFEIVPVMDADWLGRRMTLSDTWPHPGGRRSGAARDARSRLATAGCSLAVIVALRTPRILAQDTAAADSAASREHGAGEEPAAQGGAGGHAHLGGRGSRSARAADAENHVHAKARCAATIRCLSFGSQAAAAELHRWQISRSTS